MCYDYKIINVRLSTNFSKIVIVYHMNYCAIDVSVKLFCRLALYLLYLFRKLEYCMFMIFILIFLVCMSSEILCIIYNFYKVFRFPKNKKQQLNLILFLNNFKLFIDLFVSLSVLKYLCMFVYLYFLFWNL